MVVGSSPEEKRWSGGRTIVVSLIWKNYPSRPQKKKKLIESTCRKKTSFVPGENPLFFVVGCTVLYLLLHCTVSEQLMTLLANHKTFLRSPFRFDQTARYGVVRLKGTKPCEAAWRSWYSAQGPYLLCGTLRSLDRNEVLLLFPLHHPSIFFGVDFALFPGLPLIKVRDKM